MLLPARDPGWLVRPAGVIVYLIAGESSGDVLGARLMASLATLQPGIAFRGIGGPAMAARGLPTLFPMADLAVMGMLEVLPTLRTLRRRILQTVADILAVRPDVVVTIDSPGFAFRVLRRITHAGIPRVHYVAPQLWGWRPGRAKHLPGLWDALLCLLPFEPAFFAGYGIATRFVGHPVLESGADEGDAARFRARHGIGADETILLVMPGSRGNEVRQMLPLFAQALRLLPPVRAVIPVAEPVAAAVTAAATAWPGAIVLIETQDKHDAFAAATAGLVKSGTSSLEVALSGTPMIVAYRAQALTAAIVRPLVRVRYASIVNIIADAPVIPELIQRAATPAAIAAALAPLLTNPVARAAQVARFAPALAALRAPDGTPSDAAAHAILDVIAATRF